MTRRDDSSPIAEQQSAKGIRRRGRNLLRSPLVRLVLALFSLWVAFIARDVIANGLFSHAGALTTAVVTILVVHLAYVLNVRTVEQRPVHELSWKRAPQELALGVVAGVGGIAVIVSVLWVPGYYQATGVNGVMALVVPTIAALATAYTEEIVIRGVLFRIVEQGLGTWIALIISAVLFGLLHSGNDGATLIGLLSISVTAGLLLAGAYILTRRLWLSIGIHFSVNWTQQAVFGLPVSGREGEGLLQGVLGGPTLLTGGAFGIEASLIMLVLGSSAAAYILHRAYRQGQFVHPFWSSGRGLEREGEPSR